MKRIISVMALLLLMIVSVGGQKEKGTVDSKDLPENDKLVVLWTSGDPYVAERVCLMYTHAAKTQNWFDEVVLVVWGPSAKLISENIKLRKKVKAMEKDGVVLKACIACANSYGVAEELREFGFEVKGMGKPLTEYLKSDAKVLTF